MCLSSAQISSLQAATCNQPQRKTSVMPKFQSFSFQFSGNHTMLLTVTNINDYKSHVWHRLVCWSRKKYICRFYDPKTTSVQQQKQQVTVSQSEQRILWICPLIGWLFSEQPNGNRVDQMSVHLWHHKVTGVPSARFKVQLSEYRVCARVWQYQYRTWSIIKLDVYLWILWDL